MDRTKDNSVEQVIASLIKALGEDPSRPGLQKTPSRVAKAYGEMLNGYDRSLSSEMTLFDNEYDYKDLIYSGKLTFFSICEHHLLPFFGTAHIAYVPGEKIIGLSKLGRAVDIYARRLQEQERITVQVAHAVNDIAHPKGVIVMLEGQHFCSMARGINKVSSNMKTVYSLGCFQDKDTYTNRFFDLIKA